MPSPLMSAANRINLEGVPQWQPDDQAVACPLCSNRFTLFFRRHHCRRCGRVVCGNCSSVKTTYLPSSYVVCPPSQIFLETPHIPHRTCDECVEELEMIRSALRASMPSSSSSRASGAGGAGGSGSAATASSAINTAPNSRRRSSSASSSIIRAPISSSNVVGSSSTYSSHRQNTPAGPSTLPGPSSLSTPPPFSQKRVFESVVASAHFSTDDDEDDDNDDDRASESDALVQTDSDIHDMPLPPLPSTPRTHRDSSSSAATLTSASDTPRSSNTRRRRNRHRHHHGSQLDATSEMDAMPEMDESNRCPVCNRRFDPLLTESDREAHITECLKEAEFSGSPEQTHRANRMIVYRLSEREAKALGECVICFEDFEKGASVGRLECLCIYHEKCILNWFARKGAGECPVHAVNT